MVRRKGRAVALIINNKGVSMTQVLANNMYIALGAGLLTKAILFMIAGF
jgi:hypothetical protein